MITRFNVPHLYKLNKKLVSVASGKIMPDLVIYNGNILSTYTDRILKKKEIWIYKGRIAAIKDNLSAFKIFNKKDINAYDAEFNLLAPGLIDPHMHIESSMMTACAYAEPALLNGTTTIFCDSHEIANVCDIKGIEWMLKDCREAPLSIFLTLPSTIPATNNKLETAGGNINAKKASKLFNKWPEIIGLGEKMDFISVIEGNSKSHSIISETLKRNLPISGHVFGREYVAAYASSGISDTHEAEEKYFTNDLLDAGLWIFLRGGNPDTPWNSLPEAIKAVTELGASPKRVCVCTDDRDADDLFNFGLDWVVRQTNRLGIDKTLSWSMGSLHPAIRYKIDQDYGALGHSRRADVIMLDRNLSVLNTWLGGKLVVQNKKITNLLEQQLSKKRYKYPKAAYKTIKLPKKINYIPKVPNKNNFYINAIKTELPGIVTFREKIKISNKHLKWDKILKTNNLCHLCVIERHGINGTFSHGFIKNFNLKSGAVASSVGHDAHNVIVAGLNKDDMKFAVEIISQDQGGIVIVNNGKVVSKVQLPIAGLISDKRSSKVASENKKFKEKWKKSGCTLAYMGFNLLPLSVIPNIRLTNKGLVDVNNMKILPLFEY
ncbi:MAG: Adenine deaminase [Alphaproteobacteria bacterium MarineAlpha5_Bin8]|nr:MAG: Adenine deaminase [Alphaproteobacteria bacterium MarineAlpha5_Bin7]PPR46969.1 MAG: Adenine deaminase [Alphaproteobacteria bacterium MarineAlpha5_Bin8]PPR52536.1 MAG: Adenine deaminase [Alphaproteobacteria bacterium MarineAlpha5_Bin6]|tara:strand:- start:2447 stop:4258 length:1812 start_codon:yes stop_codon:yes gene_type:complete